MLHLPEDRNWSPACKNVSSWQISGVHTVFPPPLEPYGHSDGEPGCVGKLTTCRWGFKKISSKNIFLSWRKLILKKKIWKIFQILKIFQNPLGILRFSLPRYKENLKIPKGFWKIFKIWKIFQIFFFKINFLHDKKYFSTIFFKNLIYKLSAFQRTRTRLQDVKTAGKA